MFDIIAVLFFWVPLAVFIYHWVIFPLILFLLAKFSPRRYQFEAENVEPFTVSVVMCVHNEEMIIEDKLKNIASLDYPKEKIEIIIGSDNSTDRTEEIIKNYGDPRIRLLASPERMGKVALQNRLLTMANGDLVLFTDADALLTPGSLKLMARKFRDPKIAVVHPSFRRINPDGSPAESLYDRWENRVKDWEARLGALIGCYGYANLIRREYADPIPDDIILDDFFFGIRPFRYGKDVTNEPDALVITRAEKEEVEFRRKIRISSGNLQALIHFLDLLAPKHGIKAWVYLSHKVIRMIIPFLLLSIFTISLLKFYHPFFKVLAIAQIFFYVTTPLVFLVKGKSKIRRLLLIQYYLMMNLALVLGYLRFLFRRRSFWEKTPRSSRIGIN